MDVELLLARADDSLPTLETGLSHDAVTTALRAGTVKAQWYRNESDEPNDLPAQRWGIVAPEGGEGDRLLALIEPLRKAREEGQGGHPARIYRVPSKMSASDAIKWKREVYWDETIAEADLPWYLLVLGDFDSVSFELQRALGNDTFVGRLAFRTDGDYSAYVDKVLRWEQRASLAPAARQLFYTVRDGSAATTIGYSALMSPSLDRCRESRAAGTFPAAEILEIDGTQGSIDSLLSQAAAADPSVLFSMSHGLGAPRGGWSSVAEQLATQGAMSLGFGQRLTGDDLKNKPFLPGGMWFFFACFSAGTPSESAYHHWLAQLRDAGHFGGRLDSVLKSLPAAGDRPFVAALPQAALANPDGPLAVIGHVDLAWSYSFQDLGKTATNRPSRFAGIFRSLVNGSRAGVAHRELLRFLSQTNHELSTVLDEEAAAEARGAPLPDEAGRKVRKANLWMLRQDLSGYILLGDPAAQLPIRQRRGASEAGVQAVVAKPEEGEPPPALVSAAAPEGARGEVQQTLATAGGAPAIAPTADEIEEAVMAVFTGELAEEQIAATHGVAVSELRRWVTAYKKGGRDAVSRLKG